ncbi:hypothetical protein RND81_14G214500 [Saponaria officinalis]|uniref:No apical meristem-associated C-terminal domain-containing protein n=1 Tax=Saponaria officinalis TaxID=3572 RepID=A0AAW1GYR2_SAPOF
MSFKVLCIPNERAQCLLGKRVDSIVLPLWNTIVELFEEARENNPNEIKNRSLKSLQNRWDHINQTVSKWAGVYAECQRNKKSGQSEDDVEKDAHDSFRKLLNGNKFNLMHVWALMKKKKKWQPWNNQLPSGSGGSSKRSEPDTSTEARPEGIKKTKKTKGKEASCSSRISLDTFHASIREIAEKREDLGERMIELIRERKEERKIQREEDAKFKFLSMLMAKPVLDEDEQEMYKKLKEEFKDRFF